MVDKKEEQFDVTAARKHIKSLQTEEEKFAFIKSLTHRQRGEIMGEELAENLNRNVLNKDEND